MAQAEAKRRQEKKQAPYPLWVRRLLLKVMKAGGAENLRELSQHGAGGISKAQLSFTQQRQYLKVDLFTDMQGGV